MNEYPVTEYKGYSLRPVINVSNEKIDDEGIWYEYSIEGWLGKKKAFGERCGRLSNPG